VDVSLEDSSLFILGRRVERLLFWGVFLIALCFVEVFLATASTSLVDDETLRTLTTVRQQLQERQGELTELFEAGTRPRLKQRAPDETKRIDATRKKLGLQPSPPPKKEGPKDKTYAEALREILRQVEIRSAFRSSSVAAYLDSSKPPKVLIDQINEERSRILDRPAVIWGIQSPRIVALQYGGLDYKVPSEFLATALAVALAPLLIGWLGSVYITRQRELMILSTLEDYKLAFPHILNLMPVVFDRVNKRIGIRQAPKARSSAAKVNRYVLAALRSLVVLLFAAPMVGAFVYSAYLLFLDPRSPFAPITIFAGLLTVVMAIETLILFVQEWIVLHGKEFYE
jgi:hypothetical protein